MSQLADAVSRSTIRRKSVFDPMWAASEIISLKRQLKEAERQLLELEMELDAMRRMDSGY